MLSREMSGGSSHDRRKIRRLLADLGRVPVPPPIDTMNPPAKKSAPRAIAELVFGVVLTLAGITEMFPLVISMSLCVGGLILLYLGVREVTTESRRLPKICWRVAAPSFYILLIAFPLTKQYQHEINLNLDFKDSPYFSWWRRQIITHDIAKMRDFLNDLEIETPTKLPPFGIQSKSGGYGAVTPPNLPLNRSELIIGELDVCDRPSATHSYVSYIIDIYPAKSFSETTLIIRIGFSEYFNSSFWNMKPITLIPPPVSIFLNLREELQAPFADRLAAATFRTVLDDPMSVKDDFIRALMIGDSIVDNECGKWPQIEKTLITNGYSKEQIKSKDFTQSSISWACTDTWRK
jgi:hypothetical protein